MTIRKPSGFTLIEVMIVVAIVAILAMIAYPSFADQMRKSRRTEAMADLQDAQLRLERWRVDHASFAGSGVAIADTTHYDFEIAADAATPNKYSIQATPLSDQAKDSCGTLTLGRDGSAVTKTPTTGNCW